MIPLSTFPPTLARLLLCGGGGLPAAWGPLHHLQTHEADTYPWDPVIGKASGLPGYLYDDGPRIECWALPLDSASPWPARMAVVAAWMLGWGVSLANVRVEDDDAITLIAPNWQGDDRMYFEALWWPDTGSRAIVSKPGTPRLPTLPAHLVQHPPEVALLLALYDVPAIRERVEVLQ